MLELQEAAHHEVPELVELLLDRRAEGLDQVVRELREAPLRLHLVLRALELERGPRSPLLPTLRRRVQVEVLEDPEVATSRTLPGVSLADEL